MIEFEDTQLRLDYLSEELLLLLLQLDEGLLKKVVYKKNAVVTFIPTFCLHSLYWIVLTSSMASC